MLANISLTNHEMSRLPTQLLLLALCSDSKYGLSKNCEQHNQTNMMYTLAWWLVLMILHRCRPSAKCNRRWHSDVINRLISSFDVSFLKSWPGLVKIIQRSCCKQLNVSRNYDHLIIAYNGQLCLQPGSYVHHTVFSRPLFACFKSDCTYIDEILSDRPLRSQSQHC